MKDILVGEFSKPYDALTLHNHQRLAQLQEQGSNCILIDLGEIRQNAGTLSQRNFFKRRFFKRSFFLSYLTKLNKSAQKDATIHFITRGYDRISLFFLFFTAIIGWLHRSKLIIVLHAELFSFFGPMRSRHVGKPMLKWCFKRAEKTVCDSQKIADIILEMGCPPEQIEIRPPAISFSNQQEASHLSNVPQGDVQIISLFLAENNGFLIEQSLRLLSIFGEELLEKTHIVVVMDGHDELVIRASFPAQTNLTILEAATLGFDGTAQLIGQSAYVLRPLRCMGDVFMPNFAIMVEKPTLTTHGFHTNLGFVVIRKGFYDAAHANENALAANRVVFNEIMRHKTDRMLFLSAFPQPVNEEALTNLSIMREFEQNGTQCDLMTLPAHAFDGDSALDYLRFIRRVSKRIRKNDTILYATQGVTRPSLLILLTLSFLSTLHRKRSYILFHQDAFGFFAHLRSRNAGLPLLFTSFSLINGVFANAETLEVIKQYRNTPHKFHAIQPPQKHEDDVDYLESCFAETQKTPYIASHLCVELINTLSHGRALEDFTNNRTGQSIDSYFSGAHTARSLMCNGQPIFPAQIAILETQPQLESHHYHRPGILIIRKGSTSVAAFTASEHTPTTFARLQK